MCELQANSDSMYPYDLTAHHATVIEAAKVLLKSGADPNITDRCWPLGVLGDQINLKGQQVQQLQHSRQQNDELDGYNRELHLSSVTAALSLTRDLFEVLLLHRANPNVTACHDTKPLTTVIILHAGAIIRSQSAQNVIDASYSKLTDIFADILRLLFLSGARIQQNASSSIVFIVDTFTVLMSCGRDLAALHSKFFYMFFNVLSLPTVLRFFENQLASESLELSNATEALLRLVSEIKSQLKLKHLCRVAIIEHMSCRGLQNVSALGLPTSLQNYVLLQQH